MFVTLNVMNYENKIRNLLTSSQSSSSFFKNFLILGNFLSTTPILNLTQLSHMQPRIAQTFI